MSIDIGTELQILDYNIMVIDKIIELCEKQDISTVEKYTAKLATADPEFMKRLEDELK